MMVALEEARVAQDEGEVPVGCVIVRDSVIIARAHNTREESNDPTGHAEVIALREAGRALGTRSLRGTTLYVTLEPCPMCMAAIMLAQVDRLVYGAEDPKLGAVVSRWNLANDAALMHSIKVTSGVLQEECGQLLKSFFREA